MGRVIKPTLIELLAVATRTTAVANSLGTPVLNMDYVKRVVCIFRLLATAGAAGDLIDVYVDISPDGSLTWVNAVHFTQCAGNAAAKTEIAVLDPSAPGAVVIDVTSDAASGVVRPSIWGTQMRGRYTLVDAGAHGQSATFGLTAMYQ